MLDTVKEALSLSYIRLYRRSERAAATRKLTLRTTSAHAAVIVLFASMIAGQVMFPSTLRSTVMATLGAPLHAPVFHYATEIVLRWIQQSTDGSRILRPIPEPPYSLVPAGLYVLSLEFAYLVFFSLLCALLQQLLALSLVSFSACMAVGWITVYGKLVRVFCSSKKRSSHTPALRYAHRLQKLAENASTAAALQQSQAASELIEVKRANVTLVLQLWIHTCVRQSDTGLAAVAQRLIENQGSLSPSHPAFRSASLAARSLRASLVSEQARRGTYARTVRDETTTTSSIPFSKTLLLATLLTPILAHPRYPNTWNDLEPPAKLASSSAWEDLLECTIRYFDDALCHAPSQKDEDVAVQQLERVLDDTATRWTAVDAEAKAHEAMLEAVLCWKGRKEAR
ncbi:hypothetical protein JCM8097_003461 [Rhodosporidiobolus ruineniae]